MKEQILDFFEPTQEGRSYKDSSKAILILITGILYIITPALPLLYQSISIEKLLFVLLLIFCFSFGSILITIIGYALTKLTLQKISKLLEAFQLKMIATIFQTIENVLHITLFGFLFNISLFMYLFYWVLYNHIL